MATAYEMAMQGQHEWEGAFEDESHEIGHEFAGEFSGEASYEEEAGMFEDEGSFEDEFGAHELAHEREPFLGNILSSVSSLLGESEDESAFLEGSFEDESLFEDEMFFEDEVGAHELSHEGFFEDEFPSVQGFLEASAYGELSPEAEQFFGKALRGIGKFVNKHKGLLKSVGRFVAPKLATLIGGPVAGALVGKAANALLKENEMMAQEIAHELAQEAPFHESAFFEMAMSHFASQESSYELSHEFSHEIGHELSHEAAAEMTAAMAAEAQTLHEAEAMAAATAAIYLSRADRRELARLRRQMIRGARLLARILWSRRETRPALRTLGTVFDRTTRTLARRTAMNRPVSPRAAGRVLAANFQRTVGSPRRCGLAIARNVRATAAVPQRPRPAGYSSTGGGVRRGGMGTARRPARAIRG